MKEDIKRILDEHARGNFYSDLFRLKVSEEIEQTINRSLKSNGDAQFKNMGVPGTLPDTSSGLARRTSSSDIKKDKSNRSGKSEPVKVNKTIKDKITSRNKVGKGASARALKKVEPKQVSKDDIAEHKRIAESLLPPAERSRNSNKKKVNKKSTAKRNKPTKRTKRTSAKRQ